MLRGTGATSGIHLDLDGDGVVDTEFICCNFQRLAGIKATAEISVLAQGFHFQFHLSKQCRLEK